MNDSADSGRSPWTLKLVRQLLLGAMAGLAIGMVIAVNLVIFAGVGTGYETRLEAIFDENNAVGLMVVGLWVLCPLVGMFFAWRQTR